MIPIYRPWVAKNQKEYVADALDRNELSYHGGYHSNFQNMLENILGVRHVILTSNGTVSLLAILNSLSDKNKKIITPSLTYAATNSAIIHSGNTPLYVKKNAFNLNADDIKKAYNSNHWGRKVNAVMLAHLYSSCTHDMDEIMAFCQEKGLVLIEDAAEAFCCFEPSKNKLLGTLGSAGSFSFFANKTITTGEGGCVATNNSILAAKVKHYINHNQLPGYDHDMPGMNFRMTNIQAAIGVAQLQDLSVIRENKIRILSRYKSLLDANKYYVDLGCLKYNSASIPWMVLVRCANVAIANKVRGQEVFETRPVFKHNHLMNGFMGDNAFSSKAELQRYGFGLTNNRYVILPSYPALREEDQMQVINYMNKV